ncbi:hypothetical protein [Corynebacterium phoceense]|uniref:hypothetical protein n=1 Tax=Corynebacterium phoceense TaxID=1686286 RepID=UPI000839C40B|nr:hypothetical protein [Corynebacterium phoceense]
MSNPVFTGGPISFDASARVEKGHLVTVDADGKVKHSDAAGAIFGAVTEIADPADNHRPNDVAVHYGDVAVKLKFAGGDATAIKAGAAIFAAANGEVAATGTVQVGVAARAGKGDAVLTILNGLPVAAPAAG